MNSSFGKFQLVKRIGGGRLSQVFQVTRERGAGPTPLIALKRVNPALIGEPQFVQLVVREAGLLTRLTHSGLCACLEMGTIDGCPFLSLDLVEGCTLRALMRRLSLLGVKLPTSAVLAFGYQLAQVLNYLHRTCSVPLVHLDLSPQNVMLSRQGHIKLIDFGIARQLDGHNPPPVGEKIAGTVGYMSPEQARGTPADERADQYGMGILLWESLVGQRLFRGNTRETWTRMRKGIIPIPETALHGQPENMIALITRLLEPDPNRRFAHMGEVLAFMKNQFSSPVSGQRPLSALVQRLMDEPDFDPFDVVRQPAPEPLLADIPQGDAPAEEYAEFCIQVDSGAGTPNSMLRLALNALESPEQTTSPFLETLPDTDMAAESGS
jgi:eukaryotic-like serine/threonine-protein kinase